MTNSGLEEVFDRITQLAARLLNTPIALITFIDRDHQWFKSRVGLDLDDMPCELSFCAQAICDEKLLVIIDVQEDARFANNPLILFTPHLRFYAGAPLFSSQGIALGTLCVMDSRPRELSLTEVLTLQDLAEVARREIFHRESAHTSRLMQRITR